MRKFGRTRGLPSLALLLGACGGADQFPCEADAQCIDAGIAGMCQSPGWCSFPDDVCPSGQRFGDHAGDGLARTCVPEDGTTGDMPTTTIATTLDTGDPSTVSVSATSPVTVGEETVDDTTTSSMSTTDPDTNDESTTDPTGNESTTGVLEPCPTYVDEFEDGVVGDEWIASPPEYVSDVDGARIFDITAEADFYVGTYLTDGVDLTDGWVRAQIGAYPQTYSESTSIEIVPLNSPGDTMLFFVEGDLLAARYDYEGEGWTPIHSEPFSAQSHRWLQVRLEDDVFYFEVAADDMRFVPFAMHPAPFDVTDAGIGLVAGNYDPLDEPTQISWTHFEVCAAP